MAHEAWDMAVELRRIAEALEKLIENQVKSTTLPRSESASPAPAPAYRWATVEDWWRVLGWRTEINMCSAINGFSAARELAPAPVPVQPIYQGFPPDDICSWCCDTADIDIQIEKGSCFCSRCGKLLMGSLDKLASLAPAPATAPGGLNEAPDVGEGYERVPNGTVITEGLEYWNCIDHKWCKTITSGQTASGFIYRRPVKPKAELVKASLTLGDNEEVALCVDCQRRLADAAVPGGVVASARAPAKPEPVKVLDGTECKNCVAGTVCTGDTTPGDCGCFNVQRRLAAAIEAARGESK